jgi:hypothetical protein
MNGHRVPWRWKILITVRLSFVAWRNRTPNTSPRKLPISLVSRFWRMRWIWRKLVGVEPTGDTKCRTLVLKTRPSTGQD